MLIPTEILPNPYEICIWGTKEQLSKDMVSECIRKGLVKSLPILADEDHTDTWLHAMRVSYFVTHGWSDAIDVEVQFTPEKEPYLWQVDGMHRTAAALYMLQDRVLCVYDEVVEQYVREFNFNLPKLNGE